MGGREGGRGRWRGGGSGLGGWLGGGEACAREGGAHARARGGKVHANFRLSFVCPMQAITYKCQDINC